MYFQTALPININFQDFATPIPVGHGVTIAFLRRFEPRKMRKSAFDCDIFVASL